MADSDRHHPIVRFVRRRLSLGVPYGLATTAAFAVIGIGAWGFLGVVDAWTEGDDLARYDDLAHGVLYTLLGESPRLGEAVTWFGNNSTLTAGVVLVALALVLAKRYWSAFRVVFTTAVGGLLNLGLKTFFARARPMDQVIEATGYSFPSGHTMGGTVFYGVLIYLVWRLTEKTWARVLATVVGVFLIVAVGLSRVYLNVHFLTDVIGGWLAGVAWLVAALLLIDVIETRYRSATERREERARPDDADPQPHPAVDAAARPSG